MPFAYRIRTAMAHTTEVERSTFDREVFGPSIPVVVEFRADWCDICKELAPVVEKLADTHEGAIEVVTVDIEQEGRLANQYEVPDVPTFIAFYRGNSLKRRSGELTADDVEEIFDVLTDLPRVAA